MFEGDDLRRWATYLSDSSGLSTEQVYTVLLTMANDFLVEMARDGKSANPFFTLRDENGSIVMEPGKVLQRFLDGKPTFRDLVG